jgi:hypothetical protein
VWRGQEAQRANELLLYEVQANRCSESAIELKQVGWRVAASSCLQLREPVVARFPVGCRFLKNKDQNSLGPFWQLNNRLLRAKALSQVSSNRSHWKGFVSSSEKKWRTEAMEFPLLCRDE